MNFPATKQHQKYAFVLRFCTLLKLFDLHFIWMQFLHLAMDVTPACEHCRTSIWNVLRRNPISGFNGSSKAAHPGSCEIYALVKLVYSINFPIFNYWHYCCVCFFCTKCIKPVLVDQNWEQLMWLQINWWEFLIDFVFTLYLSCVAYVLRCKKMTLHTAEWNTKQTLCVLHWKSWWSYSKATKSIQH